MDSKQLHFVSDSDVFYEFSKNKIAFGFSAKKSNSSSGKQNFYSI